MSQAVKNTQDGISLIQTFEGALTETIDIINRAKALADQMANGSYDNEVDRQATEVEYLHLCDEVNQIAETDFNGIVMLTGGNASEWLENAVNEPEIAKVSTVSTAVAKFAMNAAVKTSVASYSNAAPIVKTVTYAAAANRAGGVACGDFTVSGGVKDTDFKYENNTLTILTDKALTISGTSTADKVVVKKDVNADITLKNLNIDVSAAADTAAFRIEDGSSGNVKVTIADGSNNSLKSGEHCAGMQKKDGSGTLTINGNTGILETTGGHWGAGIGAYNRFGNAGNIIINGGNIIANGGNNAAGIGDLKADLNCTAAGLGMDALTLTTQEQANYAIDRLDHALNKVSLIRGTFGAAQNRLEHKIDNLNNSVENLTSAESTIRDTDMAAEMMKFTKKQILSQSAQAMLTQANSLPQGVMSLISG